MIKQFWRCRRKNVCSARVHLLVYITTIGDKTSIQRAKEHTHDSDADVVVTKRKRRSAETMGTIICTYGKRMCQRVNIISESK